MLLWWCLNGLFSTTKTFKNVNPKNVESSKMNRHDQKWPPIFFWDWWTFSMVAKPSFQCSKHNKTNAWKSLPNIYLCSKYVFPKNGRSKIVKSYACLQYSYSWGPHCLTSFLWRCNAVSFHRQHDVVFHILHRVRHRVRPHPSVASDFRCIFGGVGAAATRSMLRVVGLAKDLSAILANKS